MNLFHFLKCVVCSHGNKEYSNLETLCETVFTSWILFKKMFNDISCVSLLKWKVLFY